MAHSIVTLGDHPQTLAVVRSLGRAGYRVIVGRDQKASIAESSRHCAETWQFDSLYDENFATALIEKLRTREDVRCLFPIGEHAIARINRLRACVPAHVAIAAVPDPVFHGCVDKQATHLMASQAGIRVPDGCVVDCHRDLVRAAINIGFPVIVKTVCSEALVLGRKAYLVRSEDEFRTVFREWPGPAEQLLVQQFIEGERLGCDFVAQAGRIVAYYQGGAIRTDMPDGTGFAVSFESVEPDAATFDALERFVRTHHYSGPGLLQCIRCAGTDELYFLEINPRLSAGVAEAVHAGLDLPLISVHAAGDDTLDTIANHRDRRYRLGSRTHWLERDALGFSRHFRQLDWSARWHWLTALASDVVGNHGHVNWQWRDPLPSFHVLMRHLRRRLLAD